jgi:hypothetical protein
MPLHNKYNTPKSCRDGGRRLAGGQGCPAKQETAEEEERKT